jgi:ubiquinone/menaquinone biosynthesis C-methylase UbiE
MISRAHSAPKNMDPLDDRLLRQARSYDDAAAIYERLNAPLMFDAPARELLAIVAPARGDRVLDVGAGTGAVARVAARAVGAEGRVVAVDPSADMLEAARRGGIELTVVGMLPHLPFLAASFDLVLSAFVLTHVDDAVASVREMGRVLRPAGRIGLSAWAASDDDLARAWADVVHEFVPAEVAAAAAERVLPGEAALSKPGGLESLLASAGFPAVDTATRTFTFAMTVDEYLQAREVCASGRALHALLDGPSWERYRARAREVFAKRFGDGVGYARHVYYAVGQGLAC